MGVGPLGAGTPPYAIIEQGAQFGQILSTKPMERPRDYRKKAAGVTKFKTKKRLGRGEAGVFESKSFARERHCGGSGGSSWVRLEAASGKSAAVLGSARPDCARLSRQIAGRQRPRGNWNAEARAPWPKGFWSKL